MNGFGHIIWYYSGKMYYGDFLNNKMNGLGVFFWGLQKKWVGYWKDGLRMGPGILLRNETQKERGYWNKGNKLEENVIISKEMFVEIEEFYENVQKEIL